MSELSCLLFLPHNNTVFIRALNMLRLARKWKNGHWTVQEDLEFSKAGDSGALDISAEEWKEKRGNTLARTTSAFWAHFY